MKILLTVKEAAQSLSLSSSKLYQLIADGRVRTVKIGRSSRIAVSEVERFVKALQGEEVQARQ